MLTRIIKISLLVLITFFVFIYSANAQWEHRLFIDDNGQETNLDYAALPTEQGFVLHCKTDNVEVSAQIFSHYYQSEFYVVFNLYDAYGITDIPSAGYAALTAKTIDGKTFEVPRVNGFILKGEQAKDFMNFVSAQSEPLEIELRQNSLSGNNCSYIIEVTPAGSLEVLNQLDQV